MEESDQKSPSQSQNDKENNDKIIDEEENKETQPDPVVNQSNTQLQPSHPPPFKTSSLPQPTELKEYLTNLITNDPYNKFCIDCHHNLSTHCLIVYGIFICAQCADCHRVVFGGRTKEQIKEILVEHWDDYQLEAIAPGIGGNKLFFTYLQEYNLTQVPIDKKYRHDAVAYYVRRINAIIEKREFTELPPAKNWDERFDRAKATVNKILNKAEKKIEATGDSLDKKMEEKNIKARISGFFKDKFGKKKKGPEGMGNIGDGIKEELKQGELNTSSERKSITGEDEIKEQVQHVLEEDSYEKPVYKKKPKTEAVPQLPKKEDPPKQKVQEEKNEEEEEVNRDF